MKEKLIEVEGDKPKVERTRKHFSEEFQREQELREQFGSVIQFSVKVLRPMDKYPWEHAVWESEIRIPVTDDREHVQSVAEAWVKTMEAGIDLAASFSKGQK
jgi:hypothetical protein